MFRKASWVLGRKRAGFRAQLGLGHVDDGLDRRFTGPVDCGRGVAVWRMRGIAAGRVAPSVGWRERDGFDRTRNAIATGSAFA